MAGVVRSISITAWQPPGTLARSGTRKMTAALEAAGHRVLYYENIEGGHGGAANNAQAAHMQALAYSFLWERLGGR